MNAKGLRDAGSPDLDAGRFQKIVMEYLKRYANDPESVQIIDWLHPVRAKGPNGLALCTSNEYYDTAIGLTLRARNELGALRTGQLLVFLRNGSVVGTMNDQEDFFVLERDSVYSIPRVDHGREILKALIGNAKVKAAGAGGAKDIDDE
jgi:hypothetical protein